MKRTNRLFSPLISLAVMAIMLISQSALAATASVSSTKLAKEEVFQLRIVAEENLDSGDIDFSVLKKDFYTGTPRFGFYSNITNGRKSVKSEWTISLAPLRSGALSIPALQVGKSKTRPIKLTVTVDPKAKTQDDFVEVQAKLRKPEFYPGELNQLSTRIIIKADSRQIQSANIVQPSVQGADSDAFNLEPIGEREEYQAVVDGMEVIVVDQNYSITASQAGKFVINGPALKGAIIDGSRRSGSSRIVRVDTQPEILIATVLAKPENYTGNWLPSSNLTLEQKWFDESGQQIRNTDKIELTVGSPVTRQITLSAEGIASEQLPNLKISYPDSIRVYEEAPQLTQEENTATLTLKQVLIAKSAGSVALPDVSLSWWNTRNKQAENAIVPGIEFQVSEDQSAPQTIAPPALVPAQTEVKTTVETVTVKDPGLWPYLSLALGLGWFVTLVLLLRARRVSVSARKTETHPEQESADISALIKAIKGRDGIKSQALLDNLLSQHPDTDPTIESEIRKELSKMQASLYAKDAGKWQDKQLIKLLKKVGSKRKARVNREPDLAAL
ncbi:BatD family protein [Vibrio sp. JC009]|uniref:BatD family protein n=1 Tax=Vibrio sp. JC009 TaxID=2912314 RepID=UPI0023AFDE64|nr:BatD family protein [Vibrio sp. JC009]WED23827.1 BatD family protein [Vibrio sp. JC009]